MACAAPGRILYLDYMNLFCSRTCLQYSIEACDAPGRVYIHHRGLSFIVDAPGQQEPVLLLDVDFSFYEELDAPFKGL
jgi:hypothetical protein